MLCDAFLTEKDATSKLLVLNRQSAVSSSKNKKMTLLSMMIATQIKMTQQTFYRVILAFALSLVEIVSCQKLHRSRGYVLIFFAQPARSTEEFVNSSLTREVAPMSYHMMQYRS